MSNIILTPYLLFFIDQMDVLFTLMKDGRLLRVKKVDSFANLSVDFRHPLAGVQFDGEKTHIRSSSVDFETEFYETATIFGYGYYPSFNKNNSLFVLVRADLLTPNSFGLLTVYQKHRKNWKPILELKSLMRRPNWERSSDSIFFINTSKQLVKSDLSGKLEIIAENITDFTLSSSQTEVACWNPETLRIVSVQNKKEIASFPVPNLNSLAYSKEKDVFYFSTYQEGRNSICCIDRNSQKTLVLLQTTEIVPFIFTI